MAHEEEHVVGVHVCMRRCPPPDGQHAVFTSETRAKTFPHPAWRLRCAGRVVFACAWATNRVKRVVVTICHAHNSMCAVMTASTPTSSTEGERGQGYGRGACVRVCCGPNAGMSLIYYHLRGWWCSGSVMWYCCCRNAAGSNRLRCASLFWNSCRLKEVAARGGGPLRLRGTWHGLGRYSLVPIRP